MPTKPSKSQVPHIEVENPAEAFHNLENYTKKILAVPKSEIDRKLAAEKAGKKRKRS